MTLSCLVDRCWSRCRLVCVGICLLNAPLLAASTVEANSPHGLGTREWQFEVTLDGEPIGTHSFRVQQPNSGETRVISEASYKVKWLFITAYQYEHRAEEVWSGDCLRSLQSRTRDGGKRYRVNGRPAPDGMRIEVNDQESLLTGDCLRSFAYWDVSLLHRDRLINPQTGEQESVEFVMGTLNQPPWLPTSVASHYRLITSLMPIDLWYDSDGRWLGLQAEVEGGRVLRYRPKLATRQQSGSMSGKI